MRETLCLAAMALAVAGMAHAADLPLPSDASLNAEDALDTVSLPTGPWAKDELPQRRAEGVVTRRAWSVPRPGLTTLQLISPLRDALAEQGYDILFECKDSECGGFDFRYGLTLLPEPDMHVDLGDYRYLAAAKGGSIASIVASRSDTTGFLHVTEVSPAPIVVAPVLEDPSEDAPPTPRDAGLADSLDRDGRVVLEGLRFATGSAELEDTPFQALEDLAEWLSGNTAQVVLVGHSDATGGLEGNIAISRARARAVADRLTNTYGVAPDRVSADGVGYLAPRANNATEEGRALNRRVEAVVMQDG